MVAERIRCTIQELSIPHIDSLVSNIVTISLGIASLIPNAATSPQILLEQADRALYTAKHQGRDRFAIASIIL
jgi:diguanylate cyclase (GGDEF)-like protein